MNAPPASPRYLNLGCGGQVHPDWINMDLVPGAPGVIACDLSRGIPLPDGHCRVVYHSHVLEHLRRPDAMPFLRECHRVLAPGGVLRVVVPDLESLCRAYLAKMERARATQQDATHDYEWMTIELIDQLVRERSGGEMLAYLRQPALPNEAFVHARLGEEATRILHPAPRSRPYWNVAMRAALREIRTRYEQLVSAVFMGREAARALAIGRFRLSGEAHQWMYDSYSLERLVLAAGFVSPVVQSAGSSLIPEWARFGLDVSSRGETTRPNSLYMEALKPA
jgi:predicted SAM-dependent methyltransferase